MFKNYFQHTEKKKHKHLIPQKFNWQRKKVNVCALTYSMHLKGTKHILLAHAYLIGPAYLTGRAYLVALAYLITLQPGNTKQNLCFIIYSS